jgi:hypothetical protein
MERIPARREAITSQGGRALAGPDRHGSGAAPALNQKLELISSHEFDRAGQVRIDDDGGFSRIKANLDRDGHAEVGPGLDREVPLHAYEFPVER